MNNFKPTQKLLKKMARNHHQIDDFIRQLNTICNRVFIYDILTVYEGTKWIYVIYHAQTKILVSTLIVTNTKGKYKIESLKNY